MARSVMSSSPCDRRQFVYIHRWRVHEVVVWHDRCAAHCDAAFGDPRRKRDVQRATVSDVVKSCEQERIAAAAA